jgi:hypothetical protein
MVPVDLPPSGRGRSVSSVNTGFWSRAVLEVARRPRLWPTAVVQAGRLSQRDWWRHPPFLPIPERGYLRFRFETQYGSADPDPGDLARYLEWCHDMSHRAAGGRR